MFNGIFRLFGHHPLFNQIIDNVTKVQSFSNTPFLKYKICQGAKLQPGKLTNKPHQFLTGDMPLLSDLVQPKI